MAFVDNLLPSLIGALVGAGTGAFAAWLFSLDLRRREREENEFARLDAAVAEVVMLLGEFGGVVQAFDFAMKLRNPAVPAPPPHLARQQLLSATLVARMAAGQDEGPLLAVYGLITRSDDRTINRLAIDYEHAAHTLVQWRQGKLSAKHAEASISAGYKPSSNPEG